VSPKETGNSDDPRHPPFHLRTLAHVGSEVRLEVVILKTRPVTQRSVLDARR